jgi:hypothetical protein
MKLFQDNEGAAGFTARLRTIPIAKLSNVTRVEFDAMSPHMRTEFALLVREAGLLDSNVHGLTGIEPSALREARSETHSFALTYDLRLGGATYEDA